MRPTALGPLGDLQYTYDPAGNRTGVGGTFTRTLLPDPVPTTTYDAANQQLQFGVNTMAFDANGNLASITDPAGVTTFTWDARNRLAALSGPALTGSLAYDAQGRRIRRDLVGVVREYQYDAVDIARERINGTDASYLRTLTIDEPLSRIDPEGTSYYLADALSSTVALTDGTGTVAASYTYEPFGRTVSAGDLSSNPLQFTGRENDGAGLYYYRARYYPVPLYRFAGEDPLRLTSGDFNFYTYVANSPATFADPSGNRRQNLKCEPPDCFLDVFLDCLRDWVLPGASTIGQGLAEAFATFQSMSYYNAALRHAATRGLTYPSRPSIFRGLIARSRMWATVSGAAALAALDVGIFYCLQQEIGAALEARCR